MGELSNKIGDKGEELVLRYFKRIGWDPLADGFDLDCRFGEKHQIDKSPRKSHGVDLAFSYVCPVVRTVRRNVLISVKNSNDDETRNIRQQIKKDLTDLSTALTCFNKSPAKGRMTSQGGGATSVEDIGILVKINKDPEGEKSFLGESINKDPIELDGEASVCFIENDRFDFVEQCLNDVVQRYPSSHYSFVVPRSALNSSALAWKPHSNILPVQSLVGGPLVLRLDHSAHSSSKTEMLMYSNEPFSLASFKRMAGAAKLLTGDWTTNLLIFPNFQEAKDGTLVNQILSGMNDKSFARSIRCSSSESKSRLTV